VLGRADDAEVAAEGFVVVEGGHGRSPAGHAMSAMVSHGRLCCKGGIHIWGHPGHWWREAADDREARKKVSDFFTLTPGQRAKKKLSLCFH
jgi:hypothetical protein